MSARFWTTIRFIAVAALLLCPTVNSFADPVNDTNGQPSEQVDDEKRVTVAVARQRAILTHEIYAATLDVMHHRYFLDDRSTVPARAMEDVFHKIQRRSNISASWISVNAKAMSIDHEPETAFEKNAARSLGKDQFEIETVEDGYYRRAETIRLTGGCVSCHVSFGADPTVARFVGLVISIPVLTD